MISLTIREGYEEWRQKARVLLRARIEPAEVLWDVEREGLFTETGEDEIQPVLGTPPGVPKEFLRLSRTVAHHSSEERWGLLYRVLWRLTWGKEKSLLARRTDKDVDRLERMAKEISRDIHKMHAFVRFQKVGVDQKTGREQFVSWFEPDHRIMPLTADFFRKRFAGMNWSIFTPTGSAHWDGSNLKLAPGVPRMEAPTDIELEDLWRTYYQSIFNPARLKVKAMQAEMPKKYWKNLPEAELISKLIREGKDRVGGMMETEERPARPLQNSYLTRLEQMSAKAAETIHPSDFSGQDLTRLREAALHCRACKLHEMATQTVFGEGPADATVMIVGEQPGDQEDLAGRPLIGPAGKLFDQCLQEAGLSRERCYVTNAVKHFKWKQQGKRRLHQSPAVSERKACQPWVMAELAQVRPEVLICLGATAAKSLIDPKFRLMEQRGLIEREDLAPRVIATVHPSYLLRVRDEDAAFQEKKRFVRELSLALL